MDNILLILTFVLSFGSAAFFGYKFWKAAKDNRALNDQNLEYTRALIEGHRAVELALKYEDFYSSTVGDIGDIVDKLGELVGKRQMLSDDPDVQNLLRLIAIAHDTLLGYINAKSPSEGHGSADDSREASN